MIKDENILSVIVRLDKQDHCDRVVQVRKRLKVQPCLYTGFEELDLKNYNSFLCLEMDHTFINFKPLRK